MKTALKTLLCASLLATLTGCGGVAGHWSLDSIKPETAKADFPFTVLCLGKDGNCCAAVREGDQLKPTMGTYKYDRDAKTLTLAPRAGPEHVYKAQVQSPGDQLKIWSDTPGKEWTAMLKPAACCGGKQCGSTMSCCGGKQCGSAMSCCGGAPAGAKPSCAPAQCPMMKKEADQPASPPSDKK